MPVYSCIAPRTRRSLLKTMLAAFSAITFIYLLFGIYGYLAFGSNVDDDVLVCRLHHSLFSPIILVAFSPICPQMTIGSPWAICSSHSRCSLLIPFCSSVASEALVLLPSLQRKLCRLAIESLLKACGAHLRYPITVSLVWLLSSLAVAVFVPSISMVIDFLGFMATFFIFIFPGG